MTESNVDLNPKMCQVDRFLSSVRSAMSYISEPKSGLIREFDFHAYSLIIYHILIGQCYHLELPLR